MNERVTPPTDDATVHGRREERRLVDELLAAARAGRSGSLVVRGEPGIGKTNLLGYAVTRGADMTVLRVQGVESEAELAFAGLATVLAPILGELANLPLPQATALRGALALDPSPAHPLAVCTATLGLVAAAAERCPVLITVDDAHWLDPPSTEALVFAARRLVADRAALLFAARTGAPSLLDRAGLPEVTLAGLDRESAIALLASQEVAPEVVERLQRATAGNPLALEQAAATLDGRQRAGLRPLDDPLPIGPGLQQSLGRQIDALPTRTRQALLTAAAEPGGELAVIVPALHGAELDVADLEPAEASSLVTLDEARIRFRHPLIRSAVYYGAKPADRRAAHRQLAGALPTGAGERRAWHLADAADRPDERTAAALEAVSADADRRGALLTAARALERSARLTPDPDRAAGRLLGGARALFRAGHIDQAAPLLDEVLAASGNPEVHGDAAIVRGQVETWRAGPRYGHELLVGEAERLEASDPDRAAILLAHAANALIVGGDARRAVAVAHRARAAADRGSGASVVSAAAAQAQALLLHGETRAAVELMEPLGRLADSLGQSTIAEAEHLVQLVTFTELVLEHWDRARTLADRTISWARGTGALGMLMLASTITADIDWRTGRWDEAYAGAPSDRPLGIGADLQVPYLLNLAMAARIDAGLGRVDECRQNAVTALDGAARLGLGVVMVIAGSALGLLELGLGDDQAAITRFEPIRRAYDGWQVREPGLVWWAGDHIEALWRAGRHDAAAHQIDILAGEAEATDRTWARGTVARCRALLAGEASFDALFAEALEHYEAVQAPFEVARTRLCRAERRTRAGRHDAARADAESAREAFELLGAAHWAAKARRVLGERPGAPHEAPLAGTLTPGELRVALTVGRGASNKEAAEQLFLSVKTVDFHLQAIYRKLGIRSRAALVATMARTAPSAV